MAQRPNILFIMTDHTGAAACLAENGCLTPVLDGLAREGRRLRRCYTTNAICSPARASLMTGTYPSAHGVWDCTHTQRKEWVDVREDLPHWAALLRESGYATGYFGKWHVEQSNDLARFGWTESDHRCGSFRLPQVPGTAVSVAKPGYRDYNLAATGDDSERPARHPAFDKGIDFVRRHATGEKPFCCFVSTTEPHDPYIPPKSFLDRYDPARIPLPASLRDDNRDKPDVVRRLASVWKDLDDGQWRQIGAAYRAVITFIDHEIGRLLDVLREAGCYDNTIVVFTSDHGDMLGAHGLATKGIGTPYEEVYNIPLILRGPGIAPGHEDAVTCTSLVDLGPTLLELAGCTVPETCQGASLKPILDGTGDPETRQSAYAEFFGQRFVYTQRIVWNRNWKYVFSPGGVDELYDLAVDPGERTNRAQDPAYAPVLESMCRQMWRTMRRIGDESLFNSQYATLRTAPVGPEGADDDR